MIIPGDYKLSEIQAECNKYAVCTTHCKFNKNGCTIMKALQGYPSDWNIFIDPMSEETTNE